MTAPDAPGTVHLLGSIHLGRDDLLPLPETVEATFRRADVVVFELDLGKVFSTTFATMRRGFFWDGTTLEKALTPETWKLLQEHAEETGMSLGLYSRAKPWLVAMLVSVGELQQEGYTATGGIDQHLYERAKTAGKEIRALETADQQLAIFDGFSLEEQDLYLRSTLEDSGEMEEQVDGLTDAWKRGDEAAIDAFVNSTGEEVPPLLERLLYRRNRAWVGQIRAMLREDRRFLVVVGAGHLVGEESVVELLRGQGFEVSR
mgnify:FL=1